MTPAVSAPPSENQHRAYLSRWGFFFAPIARMDPGGILLTHIHLRHKAFGIEYGA